MRRYQVVFYCEKHKETKIDIIINNSFQGAFAYAENKLARLTEQTKRDWIIASIYDLEIEFQLAKKLF